LAAFITDQDPKLEVSDPDPFFKMILNLNNKYSKISILEFFTSVLDPGGKKEL
jgi:hypothetical protein